MSRAIISLLCCTFVAFASAGCALEDVSEEEAPVENALAASEVEEEPAPTEVEPELLVPVHDLKVPPKLDRKETLGPCPQPWTPCDK